MGVAVLDPAKYGQLLSETRPRRINNVREYERLLGQLEELDFSKQPLSREQRALADLLAMLIEEYEARRYPVPESSPHEVLRFLMEQRQLRQADLVAVAGSRSLVSEIVNGKRGISKNLAKKFARFFGVSAELFL